MREAAGPLVGERLWDHLSDSLLLVEGGMVVGSNRAAQELFGYSELAFRSILVDNLLPEACRSAHRQSREVFARHPTTRGMDPAREFEAQRADGARLRLRIALVPGPNREQVVVLARHAGHRPAEQGPSGSLSDDEREHVVQNIFATGLLLRRSKETPVSDARIDQVIEALDLLIADLASRQLNDEPKP